MVETLLLLYQNDCQCYHEQQSGNQSALSRNDVSILIVDIVSY